MEPSQENKNTELPVASKEPWHAPLNKVTTLSKVTAAIVFIALPFIGFWVGMQSAPPRVEYVETVTKVPQVQEQAEEAQDMAAAEPITSPWRGHIVAISTSSVTIDFFEERSEGALSLLQKNCPDLEDATQTDPVCMVVLGQVNLLTDPKEFSMVNDISIISPVGVLSVEKVPVAKITNEGLLDGVPCEFEFNDTGEISKIKMLHQP